MRTITNLSQVSFPVFRLTNRKPEIKDGVVYYSNTYLNQDDNTLSTNIKIVDNLEEPGVTLAQRRLAMTAKSAPIYPLRVAIYYLGDFIKLAKSNYWFIDNNGKVFTYKKTTSVKLRFRKVRSVIPSKTTGSIIEVEGLPDRFKTLFIPKDHLKYAGILEYRGINIFYGMYDKKYSDTRRMI